MSAKTKKILLLALVIAYVVSPADFMAGPFDDLFVMLLGALANSKLKKGKKFAICTKVDNDRTAFMHVAF